MEKTVTYLFILIARFLVIGFFSFFYVTILYILFYLIIFRNLPLLDEITTKNYLISYGVGFCLVYKYVIFDGKKDEKQVDKGVQD
jgi:hypothetical protein